MTNVQPNTGVPAGGTTVMISGTGFTGATSVKFGSTNATSFTVISSTWISAVAPAGAAGTDDITVTTAGETSATTAADHYAYRSGGTVVGWGTNSAGELGDGTTTGPETCEAVPCSRVPVAASGGLNEVTAVSVGGDHSLALLSGGTVEAWGEDNYGQMCTTSASDTPVKVSGLSEVTGVAGGGSHTLALLKGGTVEACGYNAEGQLGNGTTTNSSTPVKVSSLTEVVGIAAGGNHSLAVLKNGTVMSWGETPPVSSATAPPPAATCRSK